MAKEAQVQSAVEAFKTSEADRQEAIKRASVGPGVRRASGDP